MSRRLASRLGLVSTSPTLAIKMEADRLRSEGKDVIDFGPGEPDLSSPEPVKQAAIDAIRQDFTHYTSAAGIPELRQALADHYAKVGNTKLMPAEVLVGVGGKSILFELMMSIVNPGDEVVIPAPYWVSFPDQVKLAGGSPVVAPLDAADGFALRAEVIEKAITPATKVLILNAPSNPSGGVLPRDEAEKIVQLVKQHDLWLVSDETYESFVYDPADRLSMLEYREELDGRLIFVSAFSKSWAMTGWRIGYGIAAPDVIKAMLKIQSHDTTHATSISQKAALAALGPEAVSAPDEAVEEYRVRRDLLVDGMNAIDGVQCAVPKGAFYAFPDLKGLMAKRGFSDSTELCKALITEQAVAVVPGVAFGVDGHARFSYATSQDNLREGLRRLEAFAAKG